MTMKPAHTTRPPTRRVALFRRHLIPILSVVVLAGVAEGVIATRAEALTSKPAAIAFGKTPVNRPVTKSVKVTLAAGYEFTGMSGSGTAAPFWSTSSCFGREGPATCQVNVTFTPRTAGSYSAVTSLRECKWNIVTVICHTLNINLTGSAYSIAGAKPSTINFGSRALFSKKTLTSTITVDYGYTIDGAPSGTATTGSWFTSTNCNGVRGPKTCKVNVTFTPRSVGFASAYARLWQCPDAGGTCAPLDVQVSGNGYSTFRVRPTSIDFGKVALGKTKTKSVTVTIDGGSHFHTALPASPTPFNVGLSGCASKIGPRDCKLTVSFTPTAQSAVWSSAVTVWQCPNAGGTCPALVVSVRGRSS